MMPRPRRTALLVVLLVVVAAPRARAGGQRPAASSPAAEPFAERIAEARGIPGDSARRAALDAIATDLLRAVETAERRVLGTLRSSNSRTADPTVLQRYGEARDGLDALLLALDAENEWGRRRFATLRAVYPDSPTLLEAAAGRAARSGAADSALVFYSRLVRREPGNIAWQRGRAAALGALGRRDDAARAWAIALDLDPLDEVAFRALVRLATSDDALQRLLEQVRRHRLAAPRERLLGEREVELLQRAGRPDEAAKVAATLDARRPA